MQWNLPDLGSRCLKTNENPEKRRAEVEQEQTIEQLSELLGDREADLEFEYNGRMAAEKQVEELEGEITELKDQIRWLKAVTNCAEQLLEKALTEKVCFGEKNSHPINRQKTFNPQGYLVSTEDLLNLKHRLENAQ